MKFLFENWRKYLNERDETSPALADDREQLGAMIGFDLLEQIVMHIMAGDWQRALAMKNDPKIRKTWKPDTAEDSKHGFLYQLGAELDRTLQEEYERVAAKPEHKKGWPGKVDISHDPDWKDTLTSAIKFLTNGLDPIPDWRYKSMKYPRSALRAHDQMFWAWLADEDDPWNP